MTELTSIDDLKDRRRSKARQQIGEAVAEHLGITVQEFADITGGVPDQIREALADALELNEMKEAVAQQQAAAEDEPGRCMNSVCPDCISSEGEYTHSDGHIVFTGRQNFCKEDPAFAVGCLFRMKQSPPSDLDSVTCAPIPEWAEAVNMLRAAGLLEPDDFGKWNGTDFALQRNTRIVWWALIELLVETGRIESSWIEEADMADNRERSQAAKRLLFGQHSES